MKFRGLAIAVALNLCAVGLASAETIEIGVGHQSMCTDTYPAGIIVKALGDAKIPMSAVELKNQSPTVGAANIAAKKIDAHADFCPWSEIMQFRGTGRVIYDGSETGVPYLHGVVARKDFAEKYPEIVVAFVKAIYDAERWLEADPVQATQMMEKWTGVEKEVLYLYFSKGGYLTLDPTLKQEWVETLKFDHGVLANASLSPKLDLQQWIDETYIKQAYVEMKLDYDAQKAVMIDPVAANKGLANE